MKVYIVAPANVMTGGTELLHQFSRALSDNGIENYMVYMGADGVRCPTPEAFWKYNVKYVGSVAYTCDTVLVLPETWLELAQEVGCTRGIVMVWWLSVDNYLMTYKNFFQTDDLDFLCMKKWKNAVHFVQSRYAKEFLREYIGVPNSYRLMDYINDEIMEIATQYRDLAYNRQNICLYNPRKGYESLKPVIEACRNDIQWIPLKGYTPREMAELMCIAKVYVDFGHHPGKDRIPREAAICGCCVVTNQKGSAVFEEDVCIPEYYKIADMGDIERVLEVIYALVDHYEERQADFSSYREKIAQEKSSFLMDIQNCIKILENQVEKQKNMERKLQKCRICGAEGDFDTYFAKEMMQGTGEVFPYFVCDRCQCLQIETVPDHLDKYYGSDYYSFQVLEDPDMQFDTPVTHLDKVLDVGCGGGDWLLQMARSGWGNLYGCDPFLESGRRYGSRITIRNCSIHEMEGDGTFDWIHMGDSFEHMEDPLEVLKSVWRLLKPGGILQMGIPTYPNIAFERFGIYWYQLDAPRHIFLHSRKSLEWLSRESGMAISGMQYDSNNNQFIRSALYQKGIPFFKQVPEQIWQFYKDEDIRKLQREAEIWNEREYGDHIEVSWQKSTIQAVKNGRKAIFQKFSVGPDRRMYPYPPLYREPGADYICFTDSERVHSTIWEIHVVENLETADLEPYLSQYAVMWELKQEQIQVGPFAEVFTGEKAVAIPKLGELPLVKWEMENLTPTADEEGKYIYRKNPIYTGGKYNGRPLLLTVGVPVSNQIETIDRCLSHVAPLLEQLDAELLVIDTGSTDGTVEICKKYGARVITYPWCDNMSAVRNEGLYNAKGEWYLSIDDDEWFEDVEDIMKFFIQGSYREYDIATYIQRNYGDSTGSIYNDHHTQRMARITPGLHFEGRIHDALLAEPGCNKVCVLHSYVHHYGFAKDNPERTQEKFWRNTMLLLRDVYEYPEDLRYLFQLAQEYVAVQDEIAARLFLKTIAMAKEQNSVLQGKNSVVHLVNCLYAMDDQRLFQWMKNVDSLFPLTAAERAYITWCQESLAFLSDRPSEQVILCYQKYENALEEYGKTSALEQYWTGDGLQAVEQEQFRMDADAMAFCAYLDLGEEGEALKILPRISLEVIRERRIAVLAAGLSARDIVYEAICNKIVSRQWEEWSEEIGNAFAAGVRRDDICGRVLKRLPDIFSRLSVAAVYSWFRNAGERTGGSVGGRLLEYAMGCRTEDCPVQVLCLCACVLREAYMEDREGEHAGEFLYRYLLLLGIFAERFYRKDLLTDIHCHTVPAEVRAVYRMAVVLADGRASHENVELLKQALAIFPAFYAEIRSILEGLGQPRIN